MKKRLMRKSALFILLLLVMVTKARAQTVPTAMPFLTFPTDARSASMGGLYYGRTSANTGFNSVAKLTALDSVQMGVNYVPLKNIAHDASLASIAYAQRTDNGAWFVGIRYFTPGTLILSDANATYLGSAKPFDVACHIGYAKALSPTWSISVAGGMAYSKLLQGAYNGVTYNSAFAFMTDIAAVYDTRDDEYHAGLSGGISVRNIGTKVSYTIGSSNVLPTIAEGGIAYTVASESPTSDGPVHILTVGALLGIIHSNDEMTYGAGVEYVYSMPHNDMNIALRVGYNGSSVNPHGYTAGIGYDIRGISIDAGYRFSTPYDPLGNTLRIGISYLFK